MLWTDAIDWYFSHRDVVPQYERDTRRRAESLQLFAGRTLLLSDVTTDLVNAMLTAMRAEGRHYDKTVKGYRDAVLCVWNAAWEAGLTDNRPDRIKAIRVRRKLPRAWTIDEVRKLANACSQLRGQIAGLHIDRALWFEAYVRLLWDTGLRVGDLLEVPWESTFRRTRTSPVVICIAQSKTNWGVMCQMSPKAERLAEQIRLRTDSLLVLPWPGARCILDRWFRRLVKLAGISKGGTRMIRRGAASAVELLYPGHAQRFLGHRTPGLAAKHYLDPSITNVRPVRPPEL